MAPAATDCTTGTVPAILKQDGPVRCRLQPDVRLYKTGQYGAGCNQICDCTTGTVPAILKQDGPVRRMLQPDMRLYNRYCTSYPEARRRCRLQPDLRLYNRYCTSYPEARQASTALAATDCTTGTVPAILKQDGPVRRRLQPTVQQVLYQLS
jgi:hypothetical protein